MYYSRGLESIVSGYSTSNSYSGISYFASNTDDNYGFERENPIIIEPKYSRKTTIHYKNQREYFSAYPASHSSIPEIFLSPSRQKARFIDDNNEAKVIAEEIFELMMGEPLPIGISINILPFDDFKALHSKFGPWSGGILGFSINSNEKKIIVRENHLDSLMLVIGHEIGHVLTQALPNKHDEEAKAFAFSIEWAKTIKKHNVANLGLNIKDDVDFEPARNGLHDVAFNFVDFMVKKGRKALQLHDDLVKGYISVFSSVY
jgi:hypothetical protein